jgi:hypothetical protein
MRAMRLPAAVAACALLTTTGYAPHPPSADQAGEQWPTAEPTTTVDDKDTQETEPDPPEEVVDAYMEALAADSDPHRMREGLALAEEASPAHDYLLHHISLAQAWYDQGDPLQDADVERTDQGHRLCRDKTLGAEPTCEVFTDFTHDQDLLVDMLVNDIDPGPDLVHVEKVEAAHEGVRAVLLTAYRSPAEDTLVITVEFNTVDDVGLDLFGASYTTDTGLEIDSDLAVGRYELDAATATRTAFSFPSAEPGGELHVGGCLAECSSLVDITLPVNG